MENLVEKYNQVGSDAPEDLQAQYHMNCAEVLLATANEAYELNIPTDAFKLIQGFGGGFFRKKYVVLSRAHWQVLAISMPRNVPLIKRK